SQVGSASARALRRTRGRPGTRLLRRPRRCDSNAFPRRRSGVHDKPDITRRECYTAGSKFAARFQITRAPWPPSRAKSVAEPPPDVVSIDTAFAILHGRRTVSLDQAP